MQTCSRCNAQSPDTVMICPGCQGDLRVLSTASVALKHFRDNPRVTAIRISIPMDACSACQAVWGTYPKESVPVLPVKGCSEENGSSCFYEPVLDQIYP